MRRVLALALLACGILTAPAAAQTTADATPVVGSGSFSSAPELEPGTSYADSIRPGEILYYAVPVAAGQALQASVELGQVDDAIVNIAAYDSLRRDASESQTTLVDGKGTFKTQPAAADSQAQSSEPTSGPGTWYVAIIATSNSQTDAQYDIPFTLQADVLGDAQQAPAASPSPTPTPTPTATPGPRAGGDDPSLGLIGGVGFAGLALGGAGAAWLRRR